MFKKKSLAAITALIAFLSICSAATAKSSATKSTVSNKSRHNVVLIIADDQGLDMGAYGNKVIKTPNIDHLAELGTLFTNGFATVSSCSPSRSVIYTGLYSHSNGMYGLAHAMHNQHLLPWVSTIPELLKHAGYSTCLVGKKHILPFDSLPFDEELAPERPGKRDVELMADEAGKFIKKHTKDPFFLVVAYSDPHRADDGFAIDEETTKSTGTYSAKEVLVPSHLPDLPAVRDELVQYYEAVTRLDKGVGLLEEKLKDANELKNTLVIYLSDNGRPFPGGKTNLYDDGIHLPLLMISPEQEKHGIRNSAMVSWVDIVPTILDWTKAKAPSNYKLPGQSLLPLLEKEDDASRDHIFASHNFHEIDEYYPMRALRNRQYKYINNLAFQLAFPLSTDIQASETWKAIRADRSIKLGERTQEAFFQRPAEELYDITKDPREVRNLAADPAYADTLNSMRKQMRQFQIDTNDPWFHHN